MRVLLDNNLSPRLVPLLSAAGWDVQHVGALGLNAASDEAVLEAAREDLRVLVSADTDFGQLLSRSRAVGRRDSRLEPDRADDRLEAGCVVAIHDENVRIRRLPLV